MNTSLGPLQATPTRTLDIVAAASTPSLLPPHTHILTSLPTLSPFTPQFEKDDDTNFHMEMIAGLANMRARNYSVQEVDKLKAKLIAGRIIPAIATATAAATGVQLGLGVCIRGGGGGRVEGHGCSSECILTLNS